MMCQRSKHNTNILMQIFMGKLSLSRITCLPTAYLQGSDVLMLLYGTPKSRSYKITILVLCSIVMETAKAMPSLTKLVTNFSLLQPWLNLRKGHVPILISPTTPY
jgi:hypothetical protein